MIYLNAPKGLGNAIFLRAVVLHLVERGVDLTIFTHWPEVFADIPITIKPSKILRLYLDRNTEIRSVSACLFGPDPQLRIWSEFELTCKQAGITEPVELKMDWKVKDQNLVDRVLKAANGRKIMVYQPPKISKNFEQSLLVPRNDAFRAVVDDHRDCFVIKVGHPAFITEGHFYCDMDMVAERSIHNIFDISTITGLFFGESWCFIPVLAQAVDKELICIFSRRAIASDEKWANCVIPERIFHKKQRVTAVYDE